MDTLLLLLARIVTAAVVSMWRPSEAGVVLRDVQQCVCLGRSEFTEELKNPIAFVSIDKERFLVAEQRGVVYLYVYRHRTVGDGHDPAVSSQSSSSRLHHHHYRRRRKVLDLSPKTAFSDRLVEERGLMSIAVHPQFNSNSKFYVYYITSGNESSVVSEFRLRGDRQLNVSLEERTILTIPRQEQSRENGGQLLFGTDGFLYITVGAGTGHWTKLAQDRTQLTGKVLRINVDDVTSADMMYTIPVDNPFLNSTNARPEVYALGVKNMWRCSIDLGNHQTGEGKGRMFCGDVGDQSYEEINIIHRGGNYGWNLREGFKCRPNYICNTSTIRDEVLPIHVYKHSWFRKVVIGGYVYRGTELPWLQGQYIFADFLSLDLFRLKESWDGKWTEAELPYCVPRECGNHSKSTKDSTQYILSFGEDYKGELYILTTSGTKREATIFRISAKIRMEGMKVGTNEGRKE